jgi:hypothetical protein
MRSQAALWRKLLEQGRGHEQDSDTDEITPALNSQLRGVSES